MAPAPFANQAGWEAVAAQNAPVVLMELSVEKDVAGIVQIFATKKTVHAHAKLDGKEIIATKNAQMALMARDVHKDAVRIARTFVTKWMELVLLVYLAGEAVTVMKNVVTKSGG